MIRTFPVLAILLGISPAYADVTGKGGARIYHIPGGSNLQSNKDQRAQRQALVLFRSGGPSGGLAKVETVKRSNSKYTALNLIPMFRLAAKLRNEMITAGFTDNGGAIHSAERILDILGLRLNYPGLSHINNLRNWPGAEFSPAAIAAHKNGEEVFIEHVSPRRDFTRQAIRDYIDGISDEQFLEFVRKNYHLVLLTKEERMRLDKINRSKMTPNRLSQADIQVIRNDQ